MIKQYTKTKKQLKLDVRRGLQFMQDETSSDRHSNMTTVTNQARINEMPSLKP